MIAVANFKELSQEDGKVYLNQEQGVKNVRIKNEKSVYPKSLI